MIIVSVDEGIPSQKSLYPRLMKSKIHDGLVVLFIAPRVGTVICSSMADDAMKLGFWSDMWDTCEWTDRWEEFQGSVTLQNGH